MSNPNPLLPQGAIPPKPKSTLYIKILMIVAVHVVLLGGLLVVGCNNTSKTSSAPKSDTADATPKDPMSPTATDFGASSNATATAPTTTSLPGVTTAPLTATTAPALPTAATSAPTTVAPLMSAPSPMSLPSTPPVATVPAATSGNVYVVVQGDRLGTIAKKNGVSLKALEDANPGVDPKKLHINQKLQLPAATTVASSTTSSSSSATTDSTSTGTSDSSTYVVKSGDVLTKIAKAHGTTVKALEALNDMKTSGIKVGQKLKVPVMKMASADTTPATPTAPVAPASTTGTGTSAVPAIRAN